MPLGRFVRTLGLLLVFGLVSLGSGCGGSGTPLNQEDSKKLQEARKGVHVQLKTEAKKHLAEHKAEVAKQGAARKGGHRGAGAH